MELEEINEKLNVLENEIDELENKPEAHLFMEKLLQEQEKLIERVC